MIEPLEPGQGRRSADVQKVVNYGTSSDGYDVRCAREFKVFTNVYSTVVDPKNFDERSFVDVEADVCSASSVGAGASTNSGVPSAPRRYTPSSTRQCR